MRFWEELNPCVALHRSGPTMSRPAGSTLARH